MREDCNGYTKGCYVLGWNDRGVYFGRDAYLHYDCGERFA